MEPKDPVISTTGEDSDKSAIEAAPIVAKKISLKCFFLEGWYAIRFRVLYLGVQSIVSITYWLIQLADRPSLFRYITPGSFWVNTPLIILISALFTIYLMWDIAYKEWETIGAWQSDRLTPALFLLCVCLGIAINMCNSTTIVAVVSFSSGKATHMILGTASGHPLTVFFAYRMFGPIVEEVIFRGSMLEHLKKMHLNTLLVIGIQAMLFAIGHTSVSQVIFAFLLGISLGLIYVWYGYIWSCIIVHIAFNITSGICAKLISSSNMNTAFYGLCAFVGLVLSIMLMTALWHKRTTSMNDYRESQPSVH